eukprot:CAMPEP_0177161488 /NCGR_PEP_ID=MMETSP0367-20130122/5391_1 /TAXON_ID=447022 ORGANISM="Scrippsiella hangoei-like, Strain SHHI-4" /NCGR_SAMPLE_ID=MMETSP0367 /ASSEMBLY_ACC=CAM_ASM_000362 /LENGTH=62 /DNA_ID=CAMNT_0018607221 /DNA_START=86 /DNA_END=274 /DNA_ORIENTATION=-
MPPEEFLDECTARTRPTVTFCPFVAVTPRAAKARTAAASAVPTIGARPAAENVRASAETSDA